MQVSFATERHGPPAPVHFSHPHPPHFVIILIYKAKDYTTDCVTSENVRAEFTPTPSLSLCHPCRVKGC